MLKEKYKWVDTAILALVPLLGVLLLLLRYQVPVAGLSIFNSPWNDELSYYKQIEGIIFHGMPCGYFGYNESRALVGTFGPWTPCLLFPYALVFRLIGLGTYRIVLTNLVLAALTLVGCARMLHFDRKTTLAVSLLFACCANFARYALSISPEFMVMLCAVWLMSFLVAYEETSNGKYLACHLALLAFLTLLRGYYAVYALVGFFVARGWGWKALIVAVALCSSILYFLVVHFFCSPYFFPLINVDLFRLLASSPLGFCKAAFVVLRDGALQACGFAAEALSDGSLIGAFYMLSLVVGAAALWVGATNRNRVLALSAASFALLVAALWLLYYVPAGARHVMASVLALAFIAVHGLYRGDGRQGWAVLPMACAMAFLTYCCESDFDIAPPRADNVLVNEIENADFGMVFSEEKWDNTVIWAFGCDYRYLYALPAGAGINICTEDYVKEHAKDLKSKYVAIQDGNEGLQSLAMAENWKRETGIGPLAVYSTKND